ncbi:3-hydroxyacyl-CoA dehydrogenase [Aquibium carbonis]|uniref:3-hydroxyacyl-CoA dehydrogenase n=1 Tax=Aquibium carbonis TaxID=2495581 RepID=A0A429YUL3_9HYPH|nr:FAD-dependent oxidoreductase [Aquibium carbonis]RST85024.1 3-hydroxyacyl-CoA dehydrogenase [Aquibium carbonis]
MISRTDLGGGVALLTIETAGPVNTLTKAFNHALLRLVDEIVADDAVTGIVITSAKDGFAAGGDLDELRAARTPADITAIVAPFLAAIRKLETCGRPVVAALNGTALGGGYELALGCHRRIAADRPDAVFGLPEAGLGLMPGAGGTQRLPRLIGMQAAADLILPGRTLDTAAALKAGLVDAVVPAGELLKACTDWIAANPGATQPFDRKGWTLPGLDPNTVEGRHFLTGAWARIRAKSAATNEAATAILHVLHHGLERSLDAGIAVETRQFARLAVSTGARNRMRVLHYGTRAARPSVKPDRSLRRIAVVGGGQMGTGIAYAAALAGLSVALVEASREKADEARGRIAALAERQVGRGRLSSDEAAALVGRIETSDSYDATADADMAIEAVFERLDVKQDVLRKLDAAMRPGATIASNTSTIPIGSLATALGDPSRMVGMHFFAPVEVMKLLEIVRADATSEKALRDARMIASAMRKTILTVNDGLGFYTSRVVSSLSSEGMTLVAEGVPPQVIDNLMTTAGFAIGAATLADLTKIPLLKDILTSMSGAGAPTSMQGSKAVDALAKLEAAGRVGRPTGQGLFDYAEDGAAPWPGLAAMFPAASTVPHEDVRSRLLVTQSLEAVRALEDGVLNDPLSGDVAAVLGWGYPVHLGGPFAYIDGVGASTIVDQARQLARDYGPRFEPPALLVRMARDGDRFHAL